MSLFVHGAALPALDDNKSIKAQIRKIDGRFELGFMTGGYSCCEQWSFFPVSELQPPYGDLIDRTALGEFPYNMDFCDGYEADEWVASAPVVIPADEGKP